MREIDELDLLLDAALSTYGDPGESSGLEQRILTGISEARRSGARIPAAMATQSYRRWLPWAAALAAAACLFLVLLAPKLAHRPSGRAGQTQSSRQLPMIAAHTDSKPAPRTRAAKQRVETRITQSTVSAALPKLDVFPTPHPLSPAEQALAAVGVQVPAPELQALAGRQLQPATLVSFASIHIPPLQPPDEGQN